MPQFYISEMFAKAISFKDNKRGWFTAIDLAKKIKCAPRTARSYCQSMSKNGLIERKNTFPSLSYRTIRANKKAK